MDDLDADVVGVRSEVTLLEAGASRDRSGKIRRLNVPGRGSEEKAEGLIG